MQPGLLQPDEREFTYVLSLQPALPLHLGIQLQFGSNLRWPLGDLKKSSSKPEVRTFFELEATPSRGLMGPATENLVPESS